MATGKDSTDSAAERFDCELSELTEVSDLPDAPSDYFSGLGNSWSEPIRDTPQAREFFRTLIEEADRQQ